MHAVASLLVREHDILACMFEKPEKGVPDTILVMHNERVAITEEGYKLKYRVDTQILTVTTTANPDENSDLPPIGNDSPPNAGTNHWTTIKASSSKGWLFLFE